MALRPLRARLMQGAQIELHYGGAGLLYIGLGIAVLV
jgi:hypothetical protein